MMWTAVFWAVFGFAWAHAWQFMTKRMASGRAASLELAARKRRRSEAVSRGNRTRAERNRARIRARAAELQGEIAFSNVHPVEPS